MVLSFVLIFRSILSLSLYKTTNTQSISTPKTPSLPLNGTFIITKYENSICSDTTSIEGYIPTEKYWQVKAFGKQIITPISFNPNISRLAYKKCQDVDQPCNSDLTEISCLNECSKTASDGIYYSCNFMPKSNLSLFTFTGFGDSGCNNNNGNIFPLPLTKACWSLEGDGSMNIVSFIERRMTVNTYSTNNCIGPIQEYNKGFECDQSCIDNPIKDDASVYYQCKYTSSSFITLTLSSIILYLVLII